MDIIPYSNGHIFVVPKKHSRWVWDMDQEEYLCLKKRVFLLAESLRKVFLTEGVEEVIAGVGVEHTHIHLFPRTKNEGLGELSVKPLDPKPSEKEMKTILEKIKNTL